jgi:muconolactone delta-isomerase
MRIQIKDKTLQRDMQSRGLVETDLRKVEEYRTRSLMLNTAKANQDEINTIKEKLGEIDNLKEDLFEIKNLLKSLVNKE